MTQAAYNVIASSFVDTMSSSGCRAGSVCLPGLCPRWGRCCLQEAGACGRLTQQAPGCLRATCHVQTITSHEASAGAPHGRRHSACSQAATTCAAQAEQEMGCAATHKKHGCSHVILLQVHRQKSPKACVVPSNELCGDFQCQFSLCWHCNTPTEPAVLLWSLLHLPVNTTDPCLS